MPRVEKERITNYVEFLPHRRRSPHPKSNLPKLAHPDIPRTAALFRITTGNMLHELFCAHDLSVQFADLLGKRVTFGVGGAKLQSKFLSLGGQKARNLVALGGELGRSLAFVGQKARNLVALGGELGRSLAFGGQKARNLVALGGELGRSLALDGQMARNLVALGGELGRSLALDGQMARNLVALGGRA